jgi:DUF917 family protein
MKELTVQDIEAIEIGAPAVSVEKINEGEELKRVVEILEREVGRKVDAIISVEISP